MNRPANQTIHTPIIPAKASASVDGTSIPRGRATGNASGMPLNASPEKLLCKRPARGEGIVGLGVSPLSAPLWNTRLRGYDGSFVLALRSFIEMLREACKTARV